MKIIQKILISLFSVILVPLVCRLTDLLFQNVKYANLMGLLIYIPLTVRCIFYLRGKPIKRRDLLLSIAVGLIVTTYTIPLRYIGVVAGVCTAFVFLSCRFFLAGSDFAWFMPGLKPNALLLCGITVFYIMLAFAGRNGRSFTPSILALKAWAPALSEELLFRVLFPTLIFRQLKGRDSAGNMLWVFCVVTIPFALWHCMDALAANDISYVLKCCWTVTVQSAIMAALIRKFGFVYGVYAHALCDFLAMSLT